MRMVLDVGPTRLERPVDQLGHRGQVASHHLEVGVDLQCPREVRAVRIGAKHLDGRPGESLRILPLACGLQELRPPRQRVGFGYLVAQLPVVIA